MKASAGLKSSLALVSLATAFTLYSNAYAQSPGSTPSAADSSAASESTAVSAALANETASFPPGDEGQLIAYGHDIITKTHDIVGKNVRSGMSCEACHIDAGRKPHGGSFIGIYAKFPQWNKRSQRFITLQDRLAECFLYSMNGHPPAYDSREMIALTAYIAFLSRGAPVGTGFPNQGFVKIAPEHTPSVADGKALYGQKCEACHAANGDGKNGVFPQLWGDKSFNGGAGMHRLDTMAAFVQYNMPYDAPGSLTAQQAYDVSAYVLSHPRPKFNGSAMISFPAEPARHF